MLEKGLNTGFDFLETMRLGNFIKEEKAQTALEYVLLIGIVILQAILIGAVYMRIVRAAGEKMLRFTGEYTDKLSGELNNEIDAWVRDMLGKPAEVQTNYILLNKTLNRS